MHPADIAAALIKVGTNQSAVARSLAGRRGAPLTAAAVHNVIKGRSKSERIALRISQLVAIPVAVLWPGKYPELEARQSRRRATPPRRRAGAAVPAPIPASDRSRS